MIRTFKNDETSNVFHQLRAPRVPANIIRVTLRKLQQVNFAHELQDLAVPPGNRLEVLRGDREGQHSIRINDQWRICFTWSNGGADDVEIVDYH